MPLSTAVTIETFILMLDYIEEPVCNPAPDRPACRAVKRPPRVPRRLSPTDVATPAAPCPPVLVLAFNRPDTTARVLDAIRAARPARIYLAVDGARPTRSGESSLVSAVQALAGHIDWTADVRMLFRQENLGCKIAVSEAIRWFFGQEEQGIILEDDCVAHPTFFRFAAELLDRYRDDERVMMVSADNFQRRPPRTGYSYYFSRYAHIWGWATWRRAWQLYDHHMSVWPELRSGGWLRDVLDGDRNAVRYWTRVFDDTHGERNTSWAYRWIFAVWANGGLSVTPRANLVSNIGFGDAATHTTGADNPLSAMATHAMSFPLRHPPFLIRDAEADRYSQDHLFRAPGLLKSAVQRAGRVVRRLHGRR
jgi:hypothetical protein